MIVALALILFTIIAINDFLFFRIEDSVNIAVIILFLISYVYGGYQYDILQALSIASLCFIAAVILNHYDLMGGGDVKLLFGVGLFISNIPIVFFSALSIYSFVVTFLYLLLNQKIELLRKRLAIKVIEIRMKIYGNACRFFYRILFPSAYNVDEQEITNFKVNNCILKQEIPYGVILSLSTVSTILIDLMNIGEI